MSAYFNQESNRFSSFPSDSFPTRGTSRWRSSDRGSTGQGFRGVDMNGDYERTSPYGRGMHMEDRYGGEERQSEWDTRYDAHSSYMEPPYDTAEDESWRPAREEGSWRDLRRERSNDNYRSREHHERRPRRSISPQRRRSYGAGTDVGERRDSFDSRYKIHAHGDSDVQKHIDDSQHGNDSRSHYEGEQQSPKEEKKQLNELKQETGISSATKDSKESITEVKKSGDNAELKKKEEFAKLIEEENMKSEIDVGARKTTSLEKGDKWENKKDEKLDEDKQRSEHRSGANETSGKVEVGKEEDPAKKIFIRRDFTHDDIHHFIPISMRDRGSSRDSNAVYATKQKRWVDEWKERNAALKAVADEKLSSDTGGRKQRMSAGGGGDELKDTTVDVDSTGIIDPKDYIEALSSPDLDPPQAGDLAVDLMLKGTEETVKGRRVLLSPPAAADHTGHKAEMGFFSVPVLAGPSMFKGSERIEPERPFKPGLLDPPPPIEKPPKLGLLDARRDMWALRNGPAWEGDRMVPGGAVAEAMRATVDAIADSLPQRGALNEAIKRGVTEMLLSSDGFTAEIAKLCKEEVAKMLTKSLGAEGLMRRPPCSDLDGPPKGMVPIAPGRRTPPSRRSFVHEGPSPPFHWENDVDPRGLESRRGPGPIDYGYDDRRDYERRTSYDGPRGGPPMDFDGHPRSRPPRRYFEGRNRDRSPLNRFDRPHLSEIERFGGPLPRRRDFDEGGPFVRPLSRGEEFGRPWSREREFGGPPGPSGPPGRGFGGAPAGARDARDERDSRWPAPHRREYDFERWERPFDGPPFGRRGPR